MLLALALVTLQIATSQFAAFANHDLKKLSKGEADKLDKLCKDVLHEKDDGWHVLEPHWIKQYSTPEKWLFLKIYPGYDVPDVSALQAYTFDSLWRPLHNYSFPTGYRLRFEKEKLLQNKWIGRPMLEIKVTSVGPFVVERGKPRRPAFHPESGILEYYAFKGDNAYLIRLTTGAGEFMRNSYQSSIPFIGPAVKLSTEQGKADLMSNDTVRQLGFLVWLGGAHLNAKDWRKEGYSREPVSDSQTYENLRADPQVVEAIRKLSLSNNEWLKKQAAFTLKQIAAPLAPVETPPE